MSLRGDKPMQLDISHPAAHDASARHVVRPFFLWFGLFGGPAAWSLQLLINYTVTAHFCYPKDLPLAAPTYGGMWTIAVVVNGLMILLTLVAGATAVVGWRTSRDEMIGTHDALLEDGTGRIRFMAYAGMLVSGLFLLALIMSAMPLFIVPACSYGA
ncbi:MAG TPA: hypothetical protein VII66_02230 [Gemmatimonadaceae bacterium]